MAKKRMTQEKKERLAEIAKTVRLARVRQERQGLAPTKALLDEDRRVRRSPYPQKVYNKVRRLWLEGHSPEKISRLPNMPGTRAIRQWVKKGGWANEQGAILELAREKRIVEFADGIVGIDKEWFTHLLRISEHIGKQLDIELVPPNELKDIVVSLDKAIKSSRLIQGESTENQEIKIGWADIIYAAQDIEVEDIGLSTTEDRDPEFSDASSDGLPAEILQLPMPMGEGSLRSVPLE